MGNGYRIQILHPTLREAATASTSLIPHPPSLILLPFASPPSLFSRANVEEVPHSIDRFIVFLFQRSKVSAVLLACWLLPLAGCANSALGDGLQRSLKADDPSKLNGGVASSPVAATTASETRLPEKSPEAVPPEPGTTLQTPQTPSPTPAAKNNLAQLPAFSTTTSAGIAGNTDPTRNQVTSGPTTFADLDKTPKPLQSYVQDLANLGVLTPASPNTKSNSAQDNSQFQPNKAITRREFARWLVSTNNRLNVDRPAQQVRLAETDAQPAFKDVSRSDPDFGVIQGLAEAGIIPSPLSGDSTAVTFRPNAPLTRETLLLWKVPLDTRQALPTATIDAVKQTWGFQDTAKIEPRALRAVLADYQNGDLANIRRVLGYTTLFQPKKPVTRAEAAAALWYFGFQGEGQSAQDAVKSTNPEGEKGEG